MTRILIGALRAGSITSAGNAASRPGWPMPTLLGVQSVFLLGCPTAAQPEPIGPHALACPCPDDYAKPAPADALVLPLGAGGAKKAKGRGGNGGEGGGGEERKGQYLPFDPCSLSPLLPAPTLGLSVQMRRRHLRQHSAAAGLRPGRPRLRRRRVAAGRGLRQRRGRLFPQPAGGRPGRRTADAAPSGAEDLLVGRFLRAAGIGLLDRAAAGALRVDGASAEGGKRPDHAARRGGRRFPGRARRDGPTGRPTCKLRLRFLACSREHIQIPSGPAGAVAPH